MMEKELNLDEIDVMFPDEAEDVEYYDDVAFEVPKKESDGGAWASLILGIIGSLGWIVPIIGLPVTIVGTVFGAINMGNKKNKGVAIGGFVTSLVFLVASITKGILDIIFYLRKIRKK